MQQEPISLVTDQANAHIISSERAQLLQKHSAVINTLMQDPEFNSFDADCIPLYMLNKRSVETLRGFLPALEDKADCRRALQTYNKTQLLDLLHVSDYLILVYNDENEKKEVVPQILEVIADSIIANPSPWRNCKEFRSPDFKREWTGYLKKRISEELPKITPKQAQLLQKHSTVIKNMMQDAQPDNRYQKNHIPLDNLDEHSVETLCGFLPALESKADCIKTLQACDPAQLIKLLKISDFFDLFYSDGNKEKEVVHKILKVIVDSIITNPLPWILTPKNRRALRPCKLHPEWYGYLKDRFSNQFDSSFLNTMFMILKKKPWEYPPEHYYVNFDETEFFKVYRWRIGNNFYLFDELADYITKKASLEEKLLITATMKFWEMSKPQTYLKFIKVKKGLQLETRSLVRLYSQLPVPFQYLLTEHFRLRPNKQEIKKLVRAYHKKQERHRQAQRWKEIRAARQKRVVIAGMLL